MPLSNAAVVEPPGGHPAGGHCARHAPAGRDRRPPVPPGAGAAPAQRSPAGRGAVQRDHQEQHLSRHARRPARQRLPRDGHDRPPVGHRPRPVLQQGGAGHLLERPRGDRHDGRQAGRAVLRLPRGRPAHRAADDEHAHARLRRARAPGAGHGDADLQRVRLLDGGVPRPSAGEARARRHRHRRLPGGDRRAFRLHPAQHHARGRALRAGARRLRRLGRAACRRASRRPAGVGHPRGGRGGLHHGNQRRHHGRARRARAVLQRDDRRALPGAGRAAGPARDPRTAGRGSDGGPQGSPGAAGAVREALLARPTGGLDRPRDQQPAGGHPHLREAAHPDARVRVTSTSRRARPA